MISRATGTADRLKSAADFFTGLQQQLRAVKVTADLEKAADAINSADFAALPPGAREDLDALYAQRYFQITGALHG